MNRIAIVVAAVVCFGLGAGNLMLGQNLILPLPQMIERGAEVPWYLTWIIVWMTALCAFSLGAFLFTSLRRK
jgi:hypothetical protein